MKRLLMLAVAAAAIAVSVRFARRHRKQRHAVELAGPDVIIDEVIVHFDYDPVLMGTAGF